MRRSVLLITTLCSLFVPGIAGAAGPAAQVDFANPVQAKNQIGFMHGGLTDYRTPDVNPVVIERARDLLPGFWRGSNEAYSFQSQIVQQAGAEPIHVLSNIWLRLRPDQADGCREKFIYGSLPFQDWSEWERFVRDQALAIQAAQPTGPIWFDVWNEPDWWTMWPIRSNPKCFSNQLLDPKLNLWMETYARADKVLRQTLGSRAKIVAPSTATDVIGNTHKLAVYCAKKGCRIDAIGWHMAGGNQASVDLIVSRTGHMKTRMLRDPSWKKTMGGKVIPILMTEYMPAVNRWMSGMLVSFWYAMEKAGLDGGAFSAWGDDDSRLNSLLDLQGVPRPSWWAARAYALGRTSRVATLSKATAYSLIASRSGMHKKAEILLGNSGAPVRSVALSLSGLGAAGVADGSAQTVRIYTLPESRGKTMALLPAPELRRVRVSRGKASLSVTPPRGGSLIIQIG